MKYFPQQILNSNFPEAKTSRKEAGRAGAESVIWIHCILWFRNMPVVVGLVNFYYGNSPRAIHQCFPNGSLFFLFHFQNDRDKLISLSKWLKTNVWLEYLSQEMICTKMKILQLVFKRTRKWCGLYAPHSVLSDSPIQVSSIGVSSLFPNTFSSSTSLIFMDYKNPIPMTIFIGTTDYFLAGKTVS